jgi:hypothetical protein
MFSSQGEAGARYAAVSAWADEGSRAFSDWCRRIEDQSEGGQAGNQPHMATT